MAYRFYMPNLSHCYSLNYVGLPRSTSVAIDKQTSLWYNKNMKRIAKTLKKYFVPHEENDHRPHILRRKIISFACLVMLVGELAFILGTSFIVPHSNLFGIILGSALTDETNSQRAADNLSKLHMNPLLQAAAQEKANDMAANNYFAHTSPAGKTPWYWFASVGYNFIYAGENLAVNFSDSEDVTNAWMNSPEHRANILNANFTEIGMATAQGEFNGSPAIYVVELFGTPATAGAPIAMAHTEAPTNTATHPVPPVTTPVVIASETAALGNIEQTFVAVKGAETGTAPIAVVHAAQTSSEANTAVLKTSEESNPIQQAVANPRQAANYFFLALMCVFALALALNIFIKIRIQHPDLILGAVMVIAVAGTCIILNHQLIAGFVL